MKTWALFVSVVLILTCAAAGCTQPSQEEAKTQLCQDLGELKLALGNYEKINASSTVGDIRKTEEQVTAAMQNVRQSAGQVANVRVDNLNAAYEDLDHAVKSLPNDVTAGDALQTIRPELRAVLAAQQNLTTELNCPQ